MTLRALIREYLFVSIFERALNPWRARTPAGLPRCNVLTRISTTCSPILRGNFQLLRQSTIDEELFDVTSGFEALN
jgi:F-type H+-transporting ATPase subunit gamma